MMHIGLFSEVGSAKITLRGVDLDRGYTPGALNIQGYGATHQQASDIQCFDVNGVPIPVKLYA